MYANACIQAHLSMEPFSSKSCLKKRAVSIFTPMAANTMAKLSSCPSTTLFVFFTRPAWRQNSAAICIKDKDRERQTDREREREIERMSLKYF